MDDHPGGRKKYCWAEWLPNNISSLLVELCGRGNYFKINLDKSYHCIIFISLNNKDMTQKEILVKLSTLAQREFNIGETFEVLTHCRSIYWSWGVSKQAGIVDKCLLLRVNGHHHKGYVGITLDWSDTYTVHIIRINGEIIETIKDVYVFDLVTIIDNRIEKISEYKF